MAGADGGGVEREGAAALIGDDTIVALSSGQPPAAIAILRVSGPHAFSAASAIAGSLPPPRRAGLRPLRASDGSMLDRALVLVFEEAASATGEDLVELHCHGGRAVVAAVERALLASDGVRRAEAGEFTRRSLLNGRIDLSQAQGLADLLTADTEAQRRLAIHAAEGHVARTIRGWMERLTDLAAELEASIDYSDEGDVIASSATAAQIRAGRRSLADDMRAVLASPPVERWRDGWRIVVAGPPNAGKSTLVNLLARRDAAIVSPHAGTTRDRIEVSVERGGIGYVLTDTAGLREHAADPIEGVGIERAQRAIDAADLVVWLGDDPPPNGDALWVYPRMDVHERRSMPVNASIGVSQKDLQSIERLWILIDQKIAERLLPAETPLHLAEREACARALVLIEDVEEDEVLAAEAMRSALCELGTILGYDATAIVLDRLFTRFCVGK